MRKFNRSQVYLLFEWSLYIFKLLVIVYTNFYFFLNVALDIEYRNAHIKKHIAVVVVYYYVSSCPGAMLCSERFFLITLTLIYDCYYVFDLSTCFDEHSYTETCFRSGGVTQPFVKTSVLYKIIFVFSFRNKEKMEGQKTACLQLRLYFYNST